MLDDRNWWVVGFGRRFLAAFKTSEMNVFSNMWYLTAGFAVVASKQAKKKVINLIIVVALQGSKRLVLYSVQDHPSK